ncbi:hypothetical protein D9M68_758670 [compost metagenome]
MRPVHPGRRSPPARAPALQRTARPTRPRRGGHGGAHRPRSARHPDPPVSGPAPVPGGGFRARHGHHFSGGPAQRAHADQGPQRANASVALALRRRDGPPGGHGRSDGGPEPVLRHPGGLVPGGLGRHAGRCAAPHVGLLPARRGDGAPERAPVLGRQPRGRGASAPGPVVRHGGLGLVPAAQALVDESRGCGADHRS